MLGLLAGALTGLSPGLHVNNVAALVLTTQAAWTGFLAALVPDVSSEPEMIGLLLSCFLLATAGSHAVFDFIPAVFLGAPTEDTALATLAGRCWEPHSRSPRWSRSGCSSPSRSVSRTTSDRGRRSS